MTVLRSTYVQRAVDTVMHIHKYESQGDILVFLTGQQEIENAIRSLEDLDESRNLDLYPIYSSLETLEQKAIFDPPSRGKRKVVLSTNIAQTSVTVPGITYVVDCGFVKQTLYDPKTHMDALVVVPISQAAATQRAGRAGRTQDGKVFRLYSKDVFENMDHDTIPEIQRSSLIGTVLALKKMGIHDVINFEFIDSPDPDLILAAIKDLFLLGAVDEIGNLTLLGTQIADFPISPFLSRALISSSVDFHCSSEVLTITAMLSVEDVFVSPRSKKKQKAADEAKRRFLHFTGDHLTLLNVYENWEANEGSKDWCYKNFIHYRAMKNASRVRDQLQDLMNRLRLHIHSCPRNKRGSIDHMPILRAFSTSFYVHTGKKHPQRPYYYPYLSVVGHEESISSNMMALYIGPQSSISFETPEWVIYNDIQFVNRAQMRVDSRIDFSMVSVLLGRVKLMDIAKLSGVPISHIDQRTPGWALQVEPDIDDQGADQNNLEFEPIEEVIDEIRRKELIHTNEGDVEFKSVKPMSSIMNEEETQRDKKREEYRQRYLKRKNK